ncbi:uncharacterized protein EDB91DRAFT_1254926 [Suillus paluster]|uniref:uncharacterized protein n=1 Tax=Suillus paluster TaxID=48578 RepID=UPI001B87B92E|nr:uncharacterized protein EDB91DRAFT_1254926 [Suillus paluster]KAG1725067.1 hypothetical protein EDB91DRAFT_1254926 [Suillus paluster]
MGPLSTGLPCVELPTELVLLILSYAAKPTFSQADNYDAKNPYASAATLCLVSRIVRRTVLPELLHTHSSTLFSMQKAYAQQKHHLHFEYAPHIRRIWIGEILHLPPQPLWPLSSMLYPPPALDFSLLSPVVLAAESLALDFLSVKYLLAGCLEHAWHSQVVDHERPLPWNTKTMTVSGAYPWFSLEITPQGRAFLASISHLVSLSHLQNETHLHLIDRFTGSRDYRLPMWLRRTRWYSFENLQTVSLALPYIEVPVDPCIFSGTEVQVELLTFPVSLIPNNLRRAFAQSGEGRFRSEDAQVSVSGSFVDEGRSDANRAPKEHAKRCTIKTQCTILNQTSSWDTSRNLLDSHSAYTVYTFVDTIEDQDGEFLRGGAARMHISHAQTSGSLPLLGHYRHSLNARASIK